MSTITITADHFDPITPNEADIQLADKTSKRLAALPPQKATYALQLIEDGQTGDTLEIPVPAMRLLVDVLGEMAKGHAVTIVPFQEEITTQQAADILNISRPFFVQMLDSGEFPFRKVGARRRVKLEDVMSYKRQLYDKRLQILNQLTAYDQELGLQ